MNRLRHNFTAEMPGAQFLLPYAGMILLTLVLLPNAQRMIHLKSSP